MHLAREMMIPHFDQELIQRMTARGTATLRIDLESMQRKTDRGAAIIPIDPGSIPKIKSLHLGLELPQGMRNLGQERAQMVVNGKTLDLGPALAVHLKAVVQSDQPVQKKQGHDLEHEEKMEKECEQLHRRYPNKKTTK